MADISKITLPNGNTYNLKDEWARSEITALEAIDNGVRLIGVTTTTLTNEATTGTITINGASHTAAKGDLVFSGNKEFLFDGTKWHLLDALDTYGALASKDKVKYQKATSASYTSTNSTKTLTLAGTSANVTITAADNNDGNYTPKGTVSTPTFTGTEGSVSTTGSVTSGTVTLTNGNKTATVSAASSGTATYTPGGTITQPTSTGTGVTEASFTGTYTPAGSVSLTTTSTTPTITGTVSTSSTGNTFQIKGSNAAPTISVATAGTTDTIQPASSVTVAKTVVAAAPGATAPSNNLTYYSVSDETLSLYQLGYTTGASITLGTAKTFKTGDAAYSATAPTFTGQYVKLTNGSFALPTSASFSGTEGNVEVSGNLAFSGTGARLVTGNISVPTSAALANTAVTTSGTFTPAGTVSQPTFSGTKAQISGTTTATGSVTLPTISLSHTTTEATYE